LTRTLKLYLQDISNAIQEVEEFTSNLSFEDFSKNILAVRAVTMDFIIIGEAAKHLPQVIREGYPQIPWSKIVGMKNILTHEYPETDSEILWKTAKKRLPELKSVVNEILQENPHNHNNKI
jgi:uncharacterized protein with HEPN domain